VTCPVVLKTAKYEAVHQARLTNDIFTDARATKLLNQRLIRGKHFDGFVQEVHDDPFGYIMISEIQVKTFPLPKI
jgi:hypothetical protein